MSAPPGLDEPHTNLAPAFLAQDNEATAAVFASGLSALLAVIYALLRFGIPENDTGHILTVLGLSWFVIHFAAGVQFAIRGLGKIFSKGENYSPGNIPLITLLGITSLALLGWTMPYPTLIGAALALLGAVLFALRIAAWLRRGKLTSVVLVTASVLLIGLFLSGIIWGNAGFHNPLAFQAMAFGVGHRDMTFHAAVSNMILIYGVPSTGLDGLPFMRYHVGSHWLFIHISQFVDLPLLDFYQLGYPVIFIPLFLYALLRFSTYIALSLLSHQTPVSLRESSLAWSILTIGIIGVFPFKLYFDIICATSFDSESMCVALAIAFLIVETTLRQANSIARGRSKLVFFTILFPLLMGCLGLLKLSVMIVVGAGVGYLWLRASLWRKPLYLVSAVIMLACCSLVYFMVNNPSYSSQLQRPIYFGFLRNHVKEWIPFYIFLFYPWLIVYLVIRLRQLGGLRQAVTQSSLRSRNTLDLELSLVIAGVATAPGLLTSYISSFWFLDVQYWLCHACVLGAVLTTRREVREQKDGTIPASAWYKSRWVAAIASLVIFVAMANNVFFALKSLISLNLLSRGLYLPAHVTLVTRYRPAQFHEKYRDIAELVKNGRLGELATYLRTQAQQVQQNHLSPGTLLGTLRELQLMPLKEKRQTLLYVPASNASYWELFHEKHQGVVAFLAPALTGIAMIEGVPGPNPNIEWSGFGFELYDIAAHHRRRLEPPSRQELCRRAAAMGFATILVVDLDEQGAIKLLKWPCR